MGLKVYGGFDPVNGDFAFAFRITDHNEQQSHRGVITSDARIQYQPPTAENMRPTLYLLREEAEALGKFMQDYGLTPKPADTDTPLRAHLADAISTRDRLLVLAEKEAEKR